MAKKHRQFATFIAKHRKLRDLSQPELAEAVGASKSKVYYWESGEYLPSPRDLQPLAEALGVAYEDLFALVGYTSPTALPGPAPYLRAKFPDAPKKALAEAERFFEDFKEQYGRNGDADKSDR